jgi:glycogen synthase
MGGMSLSLFDRVRRAGLPSVGVVGDVWMLYAPKEDKWFRFAQRAGPLAAVVARDLPRSLDLTGITWLFMSDTTRRQSLADGIVLDRAEVAHPGVNPDYFRAAPEPAWRWHLLYVGRLDERKGVTTAVEALPHLPEEATLTVLGSGDDRFLAQLKERTAELGLSDRIEFALRPRDELPAAYAEADVLLFPVRWEEPWGVVPLEAMAVGTPVVATGTGGSTEFLRDGENALVLGREATPERFADAVRRLAADGELRRRLREGGRATADLYTERAYNERIASALASAAHES